MAQSFYSKGQAGTNSYNRKSAPEDTWEYRQASFHHVHMIHVRYFDNLMWVDQCLGAVLTWTSIPLMINPYCKRPQLQKGVLR